MIYPKKKKLNIGLPIEARMDKTEKLRIKTQDFRNHIKNYIK